MIRRRIFLAVLIGAWALLFPAFFFFRSDEFKVHFASAAIHLENSASLQTDRKNSSTAMSARDRSDGDGKLNILVTNLNDCLPGKGFADALLKHYSPL